MGDGGRSAIALEAELDVAREVVLADTRRATTNTERRERRVAREHELNLAERAERRNDRATQVLEEATASLDRRKGRRAEVGPRRRRERAAERARVARRLRAAVD